MDLKKNADQKREDEKVTMELELTDLAQELTEEEREGVQGGRGRTLHRSPRHNTRGING